MDLSTIRAKLDNGMYTNRQDFVSDIRLIIANCYTYNATPTSPVRKAGEAFEKLFNTCKWNKTKSGSNADIFSSQYGPRLRILYPLNDQAMRQPLRKLCPLRRYRKLNQPQAPL